MAILYLDINYNLIQNIRLVHALSDLGYVVGVKEVDFSKFSKIFDIFTLNLVKIEDYSDCQILKIEDLEVSHSEPYINLCGIRKDLVFPLSTVLYLKNLWGEKRASNVTFTGMLTGKRKSTIFSWCNQQGHRYSSLSLFKLNTVNLIPIKLRKYAFQSVVHDLGGVAVVDSIVGRTFPQKAFDIQYYNSLLDSKFVLCPNGDFVWTYRFFESILCGAIPIVEDDCPSYIGFKYYHMSDDLSSIVWDAGIANFNFELLKSRLCFSNLDKELLDGKFVNNIESK